MDTMSKKELAEAKKLARALRIRRIRQRITAGAAVIVAVFSGVVLYRSVEQQSVSTTTTAAVTRPADETYANGDDSYSGDSYGDDYYGEESDEGGSTYVAPSTSSTPSTSSVPSTSSAPLVTSQS